jgi:ribonuclease G
MERNIIINFSPFETRLAILEEDKLVELWVERPENERMVGDIYKGEVKAIFPGMQAAFIDIGTEKNAFLHLSDITQPKKHDILEEFPKRKRKKIHPKIEDLLKKDQKILVQVIKEPMGTKGARVTTSLSLAGRYVVLTPGENHIAVSRRINEYEEKKRLRKIVSELKPNGFGLIVRTVARGKEKKDFRSDIKALTKLWGRIKKKADKKEAPELLHQDIGMVFSVMRDLLSPQVRDVVIDSKKGFKRIRSYLRAIAPAMRSKIKLYSKDIPIFDFYNIESQIDRMLERKVWIKKGAYIVIDQTEAMVTIDVNTGRYVGKSDQPSTILQANLEAAKEIARQIRLRDIGGLIIIDFIDMDSKDDRKKVYDEFRTALKADRSKFSLLPISDFGLVEMTRERVRPSLIYTLSDPCPVCGGSGRILSLHTMAQKIERWFKRAKALSAQKDYRLVASPELTRILTSGRKSRIRNLERELRLKIEVKENDEISLDSFKIFTDGDLEVTDKFKSK